MASIMAAVAGVSSPSVAWSSSCRATPAAPLALTRSSFYGRVLTSSTNARTAVTVNVPLRIEAREPTKRESIKVRHRRIRKKLNGTTERPRLAVFRSNKHLYAQVIDDTKQSTLASSSTLKKGFRDELGLTSGPTMDAAKRIGEQIAQACLEKGIEKVAFDRGGFAYHGQIEALADAARAGGLNF